MEVSETSIPEQRSFDGVGVFPFVLSPTSSTPSQAQVHTWAHDNKDWVAEKLLKHGAILFRGFGVSSPEDFDSFATAFGYVSQPYDFGAGPRKHVVGNVFTASEAPPHLGISYHHEMAYLPNWPKKIIFYCNVPPTQGGETPIIVSNELYNRMLATHPDFVSKLESRGAIYPRIMPPEQDYSSGAGRSWKSVLKVNTKEEAERKCEEIGKSCEWMGDNLKMTDKVPVPTIQIDERTGKKMWFNAVVLSWFHQDARHKQGSLVVYGDGEPIEREDIIKTRDMMDELAVAFQWKKGDVLVVDNRQVLHARRPFVPPRDVHVWLTQN